MQLTLKEKLVLQDDFAWSLNPEEGKPLSYVGAVDISYSKNNNKKGVAALIVMKFPELHVVYEDYYSDEAEYPYIPGFLAFKEVPSYKVLFERLQ